MCVCACLRRACKRVNTFELSLCCDLCCFVELILGAGWGEEWASHRHLVLGCQGRHGTTYLAVGTPHWLTYPIVFGYSFSCFLSRQATLFDTPHCSTWADPDGGTSCQHSVTKHELVLCTGKGQANLPRSAWRSNGPEPPQLKVFFPFVCLSFLGLTRDSILILLNTWSFTHLQRLCLRALVVYHCRNKGSPVSLCKLLSLLSRREHVTQNFWRLRKVQYVGAGTNCAQ